MTLIDKLLKTNARPEKALVIVTGAAGFIGSCVVQYLNDQGYENLVLVDDFGAEEKRVNWEGKNFEHIIERYNLFNWLQENNPHVNFIIHLGARTDTTEFDYSIHQELNVTYSQDIWKYCVENKVPLIYASSAATYGSGELGYSDDHNIISRLKPLNPYGVSKNEFDKWALEQEHSPPFWAGLKFFNVYGPNEYHKNRMASVIYHSYNQIKSDGIVKLFKSHKQEYNNGEQLRDFIYVKDIAKVIYWMIRTTADQLLPRPQQLAADELRLKDERVLLNDGGGEITHNQVNLAPGIYNVGTGKARSFLDLVKSTFAGLNMPAQIVFTEMPEDIRDTYQYFTEAETGKLRTAGYKEEFYQLEEGVVDYVRNYLSKNKIY